MFNAPCVGEFGIKPTGTYTVDLIIVVDSRWKTDEGIGLGSTREAVRKAYGDPWKVNEQLRLDQYWLEGIDFAYTIAWKVEAILIY